MEYVESRVYPGYYKDSVALMALTAKLEDIEGILAASVVMGTAANIERLTQAGLAACDAASTDLVVAVGGKKESCEQALELADNLLKENDDKGNSQENTKEPSSCLLQAVSEGSQANLALISVPGPYAAAEGLKALTAGMDVMLFSDNVPGDKEITLKKYASQRGLLVMGPDCGTAIINGVPLGFANNVAAGPIAVVGASGTGMQEICCRIDQLGGGISQAIGTGSHDLSLDVGGISTRDALRMLDEDPDTSVIVLVSKPPSVSVASSIMQQVKNMKTEVVVCFVGPSDPGIDSLIQPGRKARTLAEAADIAVELVGICPQQREDELKINTGTLRSGRYVRGIFTGGTFAYEAQTILREAGLDLSSNSPIQGVRRVEDPRESRGHVILDMGDDEFTDGRPHPMIDPRGRDERFLQELRDPDVAVVIADIVLGYGSADTPEEGIIRAAKSVGERKPLIIAHVCGTESDRQGRENIIRRLNDSGIVVAGSNAEAAYAAAHYLKSGGEK